MAEFPGDRTQDLTKAAPALRVADTLDCDAITALYGELIATHGEFDERYRGLAASDLRLAIAARLDASDARFWLAIAAGKTVAFCGAEIEDAPSALSETRRGHLGELFVAPGWRRGGLGGRLVLEALAWCREQGARRVAVRVLTANQGARRFWKTLDFASVVDVMERRV